MFYIAQFLGFLGLILLVISFQKNNKKYLLTYQIFSSLLFAIQYLLLGAYSGFFMNLMGLIRNGVFSKFKDKTPLSYLIIIVLIMIILTVIFYDNIYSLLPAVAIISYSIAIWQKNLTIIRVVELISSLLFIVYNIKFLAIAALISAVIEFITVLVAIIRFDIKKEITD